MTPVDYPARPGRRPKRERERGETFRTFVAVFPPEEVLDALDGLRQHLEPGLSGLRWVARPNLHFTFRFFGDLTLEQIDRAKAVLDATVPGAVPFELELSGVGVFPNWRRPRVLWVGTGKGHAVMEALARSLERGFRDAGLGKSDKKFVPHLTVGRWRDTRGLDPGASESTCRSVGAIASFTMNEVGIIRSELSPQGSRYTVLHHAALAGARGPGTVS